MQPLPLPTSNPLPPSELTHQALIAQARKARERAAAPYSHFAVGAALETSDGRIWQGCNVESASYGLSMCAERVAIFKALSEGLREFTRMAIIADTPRGMPVRPCGACRQVIAEWLPESALIVMANLHHDLAIKTVSELLPFPFDQTYL